MTVVLDEADGESGTDVVCGVSAEVCIRLEEFVEGLQLTVLSKKAKVCVARRLVRMLTHIGMGGSLSGPRAFHARQITCSARLN
jgi:hypothetical protein